MSWPDLINSSSARRGPGRAWGLLRSRREWVRLAWRAGVRFCAVVDL